MSEYSRETAPSDPPVSSGACALPNLLERKWISFSEKTGYTARMADTYTIESAQQKLSALVEEAADHPITITKQGHAVAVLVSIERMEAIGETMELLADPMAMSAIRKHRAGSAQYHDASALDEIGSPSGFRMKWWTIFAGWPRSPATRFAWPSRIWRMKKATSRPSRMNWKVSTACGLAPTGSFSNIKSSIAAG